MKNNFIPALLLSSFLLGSQCFAQDCAGMVDNEEQRLDKTGGVLSQSRIQDQDGLGTCYANATSVALQTALPGNPDVSYLQLAFSYGEKEVAPKNSAMGRDSAYQFAADGTKGKVLIHGGHVCQTIKSVKDQKIGGVCLRDDVALEKTIFNSKTKNSKDSLFIQNKVIGAVSEYYDSTKLNFGVDHLSTKDEVVKRVVAFNHYKIAFDELIKEKQTKFTKESCLKSDISNAQTVVKDTIARIYTYLINKHGDPISAKIYNKVNGKASPDLAFYFFLNSLGSAYKNGDEVIVTVDKALNENIEKKYLAELNSTHPPKDALSSLRNMLINFRGPGQIKDSKTIVDKLISNFSPEDKELLVKDYNRYVKKDVSECMDKNALAYYASKDGLIKDFSLDPCLKGYLVQGKNIQNLASVLGQNNFSNINTLNSFMNKLPDMNYEEAMRAIVAPECSNDKKIKIPESLTCESTNFNYLYALQLRTINDGALTYLQIQQKIKAEETEVIAQMNAGYAQQLAVIEGKYAGKSDAGSLIQKSIEKEKLEKEKNNRKNMVNEIATERVSKQLAGPDEPRLWNEYFAANKKKFNTDAVSLLKNAKQAIPISVCTSLFTNPSSTALHSGRCENNSTDGTYKDVAGYHAVTVIGVRCQKGKLNYLIQNSWGDWSAIKQIKNTDGTPHFESEFGKAWMNEDEILNNTFDYQKISK